MSAENQHDLVTVPEARRLLDVVLRMNVTVWYSRPGVDHWGYWRPATHARRGHWPAVAPGLFVPTAVALYETLLRIYRQDPGLLVHLVSLEKAKTPKRDLRVGCAALMLVQPSPELRALGQELILLDDRTSRTFTPKGVLRVAGLLETPEIAALNRQAFGLAGKPLGRWKRAARHWLRGCETSPRLATLVKEGWKETLKAIARKCGYRPLDPGFFTLLGWKQRPR
ncbi:MAG TPA: hypothetical protein VN914_15255 [Polyangia bacterium]|nr:hypothetical protein [Polyangia bacterium]